MPLSHSFSILLVYALLLLSCFKSYFFIQYKATDFVAPGEGKLELVYSPANGEQVRMEVYDFKDGGGVGMAMYNTDKVKECFDFRRIICV